MSLKLLETYVPDIDELDAATVQDTTARAVEYFLKKFPNLDMTPASPMGDLGGLPFGYFLALIETALDRFMSDLDLGNVASGTIYNCDFVRQFLKNFAVYSREGLQSAGVIRLTFNVDQDITLDRGMFFGFNDSVDTFTMRLPYSGPMEIRRTGLTTSPGMNSRVLVEVAPGVWSVDVPVNGVMNEPILRGAAATVDRTVPGLVSALAASDFEKGLPPESLPSLAKKTRETFYASSFNHRNGASRFLFKEFPDLTGASVVMTGDNEMVRDSFNVLGMGRGSVDVYVKSSMFGQTESMTVRLDYVVEQDDVSVGKFIGRLYFNAPAVQLDSIKCAYDPAVDLHAGGTGWRIFSRSNDMARAPMVSAGFSALEDYWVVIDMPVDSITGDALLVPSSDTDGTQYALFTIDYRSDPLRQAVADVVESPDTVPVGVDVLVKGFPVMHITRLDISYTRKRGHAINLEGARTEIHQYVRSLGYPNVFSEARIYDSMYFAGADDVVDIGCSARLKWSIATMFLPEDVAAPDVDYAEAYAGAMVPRQIHATGPRGLLPEYRDIHTGTAEETFEAVGIRNVAYILDADDIKFTEVIR